MERVDVYRDRRPLGQVPMRDDVLDAEVTPRGRRPAALARSECGHAEVVHGFAYRRSRDEHWPVLLCERCLTLLAGRDPFARTVKLPRWKYDERSVGFARWAREWPKRGRPVRRPPPESVVWPDAA